MKHLTLYLKMGSKASEQCVCVCVVIHVLLLELGSFKVRRVQAFKKNLVCLCLPIQHTDSL